MSAVRSNSAPGSRAPNPANRPARDQTVDDLPDDPRLMQAVQEYLAQLESGQAPERRVFLERYADIAGALAQCLDGLELVHKAAARERLHLSGPSRAASPLEAPTAEPLGDFQLLREIGRGGMGVVYEATQLSLGRRVAVKVLPLAATFDAKHLQRFRNEAQAAAQLHHTNIVPVYAVGCERGVHFYAMQLIDGQSLAAVIQQMRQEAGLDDDKSEAHASALTVGRTGSAAAAALTVSARGGANGIRAGAPVQRADNAGSTERGGVSSADEPRDTLSQISVALTTQRSTKRGEFFRSAARLIVQAAEGLEHAHQFGIVHRDVKPANLLVDGHGRLWITDFGVAQFHAEAGLTQTGDVLGTLRYMSPEQASGQRGLTDARTDVYSLGATLYELATLRPIFAGNSHHAILQAIVHKEPKAPRAIEPTIPVELETIILKAVAKSPAERYASARELAADLGRYLEDKPIQAKRPSLLERTRKWLRRHPAVLVSGMVLALLVAIGAGVSAAFIGAEKDKTQKAYEAERKRAEEAEEQFQLARRSVHEMIDFAEQELGDNPQMQGLRKRLLETALAYYQEFIERRRDNPGAQAELEATRNRVQKILTDLAVLEGDSHLFLLMERDVLDDLGAKTTQRKEIGDLLKRQGELRHDVFRDFHKLTAEERRAKFVDMARQNEADLADILDKEQIIRLRQVALQSRGPLALCEPDIAAALKLTTAQRERIRGIGMDMFFSKDEPRKEGKEFFKDFRKDRKGGKDDWRKEPFDKKGKDNALDKANARIIAILNPAQIERWNEMIGRPFRGRIAFRFPGPLGPLPIPPVGPAPKGGPPGPKI